MEANANANDSGWDIYNAKNKLDQAAVKTNSVIGEYTMEKINGLFYSTVSLYVHGLYKSFEGCGNGMKKKEARANAALQILGELYKYGVIPSLSGGYYNLTDKEKREQHMEKLVWQMAYLDQKKAELLVEVHYREMEMEIMGDFDEDDEEQDNANAEMGNANGGGGGGPNDETDDEL